MFRTRVIYLWLHMVAAFVGLLLALLAGAALLSTVLENSGAVLLAVLLPLPFALVGCGLAIFGSFPMMSLMQRLFITVGTRNGRPADFGNFRRCLGWYSLVPAALPGLLLLVPRVRELGSLAGGLLAVWAGTTLGVWRYHARQLYQEWQAGQAH